MSPITLANSTHRPNIDRILKGVIGIFEQVFSERIRGYYLRGSHRTGNDVPNSDLDLYVIFKENFRDEIEIQQAVQLCESCALIAPMLLEIAPGGEIHLGRAELAGLTLNFKLSTQFLYGEDIRDQIILPASEVWLRWVMHNQLFSFIAERPNLDVLVFPLGYPDPQAEFYGYDRRTLPSVDGGEQYSTKGLITTVCWLATALVAFRTGNYVGSKREAVESYKAHIGGEWSDFVEKVYDYRSHWHYLLPVEKSDRQTLGLTCQRALEFSNHFLEIYQGFLLDELNCEQPDAQLPAINSFIRIVYPGNQALADVLEKLRQSKDQKIRDAANTAADHIDRITT
jgi:hypothetical protein